MSLAILDALNKEHPGGCSAPAPPLKRMVSAHHLGRKTGQASTTTTPTGTDNNPRSRFSTPQPRHEERSQPMPGSVLTSFPRTPIGRLSGALSSLSAVTLGGIAIGAGALCGGGGQGLASLLRVGDR